MKAESLKRVSYAIGKIRINEVLILEDCRNFSLKLRISLKGECGKYACW
jgi:hypothetical protein